jgi:lysophospholipase L1-like esterase
MSSASTAPSASSSVGPTPSGEYMPCPTNGDPCAVLPLGDSITEGFGYTGNGGGYRVQLYQRALDDGKSITFTGTLLNGPNNVANNQPFPRRHEGHGGYTIDGGGGNNGISGQVTSNGIGSAVPHIVLLMIGTNDLNGNVDVAQAPTRLGKLVDQIIGLAPNALVVVASIIPMNNGNGSKVGPYNTAIAKLVTDLAEAGKHVKFADNHAAFTSNANYTTAWMGDALHPNVQGYDVLGDSFYEVIQALLPDAP